MSRRGWFLFAAMGVIWGIPYLLIKVADGGVSVPVLVCTRVALGSLLLLPAALRGGHLRALKGNVRWLAAFTAFEIVGPFALLSNAEKHLPSSTSGLLVAAVPIFSALLAWLTRAGDRLTLIRWAGLAIGLSGVALLAGPSAGQVGPLPVIEVLLVALGYAIGPLIANRKLSHLPPVAVNTACLGTAALVYAPFAALTWPREVPSVQVLLALAALGVVCTGAAFLVFFRLIAEVGPARATVITYINPAVAVTLGVLVLGEHLTAAIGVSFVLILGGSVLATRPSEPKGRGAGWTPREPKGAAPPGLPREPKGAAADWTEERRRSDEGPPPQAARSARRRVKRRPEASGTNRASEDQTSTVTTLRSD